jgi:hypothetical protein
VFHLSDTHPFDSHKWVPNSNGKFTTKYAFFIDLNPSVEDTIPLSNKEWNSLWNAKICACLKLMLWKTTWDILPTKSTLSSCIPSIEKTCILYNSEEETVHHLFNQCPHTQSIWLFSTWPMEETLSISIFFDSFFLDLFGSRENEVKVWIFDSLFFLASKQGLNWFDFCLLFVSL